MRKAISTSKINNIAKSRQQRLTISAALVLLANELNAQGFKRFAEHVSELVKIAQRK